MPFQLPKIYPITDATLASRTHAEQVARLLSGGATFIQLREKKNSPRDFFADASAAISLARAAGVTVIINDRVDIALALEASGVHLGQTDMPASAARQILGSQAIIGYSTHNLDQVRQALELPIDYLAFGPVFSTRTKENPDPITGLDHLHSAKTLAGTLPVVAIGGIRQSNLAEVFAAGADSAAIISEILSPSHDIAANLRKMLDSLSGQPR